ncbi:patellin-6 [Tanacetum coccineum]
MWGIPIHMETSETAKADIILLNFLRAKNSRVQDAYNMLIKSLEWRKAYGADSIVEQDLGFKTLENRVCYNMGYDRQGCPVSYTDYSDFFEVVTPRGLYEQTSLYKEIFSIYENQKKFIRWRIQVIERLIRMLNFKAGGVNSIVLVQDYKHRFSRPLLDVDEKIFSILRDNYPGMISYKILLNVPWISRAVISLRSLFNGNESMKLVISDEASVPETLYKLAFFHYI